MPSKMRPLSENTGRKENEAITNDECTLCLDIFYKPCQIVPCMHYYCDPCLRRSFHSGTKTCPRCTKNIDGCYFDKKLDEKIKIQYGKRYVARKQKEESSDVYDLPLPGDIIDEIVDSTGRERKGYILLLIMFVSYFWSIFSLSNVMRQ